jgi:kinesin family protein 1
MSPAGGGNIKVVVRVRPFNSREKERNAKCIVQMKDSQTVLTPPDNNGAGKANNKDHSTKTFAFDKSYWSFDRSDPHYAGQDDLHTDLGKPLLDNAFGGYNNCIFAYGQTGSGKSYSMMGYGTEYGVIPKICQDMFLRIEEMQKDSNLRCTVEVSYLEIYNERVRDLLNPTTKGNLKVREHPSTGPYVEDLAKLVVSSFNEIEHLMDEGNKARTVAATNMNETSSRSHAVFTLTLTQKRKDEETKMSAEKVAKISLVDLAGSERATSTGATGARLKEGAEINRSLSTLGRVIAALADLSTGKKKGKAASQVPYRDSVLTWLLKDSLGGNSMTAMIAAISPADINFDETLSTLRYADSAKRIKNHAVVNEDANARMIRELKEELATLRGKLSGGGGGGLAEEVYAEGTPLEKQIVSITQTDGTVKKVSKAEIAEQLNQSEKLYSDLNQTWEEKLQKTEEIHKEREAALEELGISIEKGFIGLHTPKKMPHLVNLSDDPLLAECLVYNLKPGTTTVGNVESNAAHTSEIRLNGSSILHEHCTFENAEDVVTVVPKEGAAVMVNGKRITEPKRLRSGYRIILGDFHIFRFNHPAEARAERAEQSLLRHSVTASQLADFDLSRGTPSPSPRPGHDRTFSKTGSDFDTDGSRPDSPIPFQRGRDFDWSFARREAASAILGPDQKIAGLTDEELNILFEDVQKARAERKGGRDAEDDLDSTGSYPVREKYASTGTIDNFSLDTALTMPSTPRQGEVEDKLREARGEMQVQLDKQKEEFQEQLKTAEAANVEVAEIRKEKARMEESLKEAKEEMLRQLEVQRVEFEERIKKLSPRIGGPQSTNGLSEAEIEIANQVLMHWRNQRYVRMAEAVLSSAATLKEAQIMSQEMDESVVFQFAIVDVGHALCSSYDMVLNGISGEDDDLFLENARKPCVGVRVIDYRASVVHLWSLEKLQDRVRLMRQMHQYLDRPEYLQHFRLDNPFMETCMPQYTLVGDVDVPLTAVFESRVQDFSLDVLSPYTSSVVSIIKLSLEPSSARAPSSTLKFNVVMHDMLGFAEREGTEVHAQLFIPGISEEGGVTTTQMISDFDEGPIRFESVHSMSVPLFSPNTVSLRVAIFAKVSSMHLDKLLSWDDMRDSVPQPKKKKQARISENQFLKEEKHDVFARVQILELAENGEYLPVEVIQTSDLDAGAYQLHQGLQRRIVIHLTHSSGETLKWQDVTSIRVGRIQLIDHGGKSPDLSSPPPDLQLKLVSTPTIRVNANGTCNVTIIGQWDSSLHDSLLLDRTTADKYRVKMSVSWSIASSRLSEPMKFSTDVALQILPRSHTRQTSMFASLWQTVRVVHSTSSLFSLGIRPSPVKKVGDLWRMNTQHEYVKGEEGLTNWTPRTVSLVRDFIASQKRRRLLVQVEATKVFLSRHPNLDLSPKEAEVDEVDEHIPAVETDAETEEPTPLTEEQKALLEKVLASWPRTKDPTSTLLLQSNTEPPSSGVLTPPLFTDSESDTQNSLRLMATITPVRKNPEVLKGGYLLVPSADSTKWIRRFVELRRPYLYLHSVPDGEAVGVVSLRNSRVDHRPEIARLLKNSIVRPPAGGFWGRSSNGNGNRPGANAAIEETVFALYAMDNTWLFRTRSERDKVEWIFKIDMAYFGSGGSGSARDSEDD